MKKLMFGMCAASALMLAACGGSEDVSETDEPIVESSLSAEESAEMEAIISSRQAGFKTFGRNMRAINQSLQSGSPDAAVIAEAAATIHETSMGMETWFPEGSGPESGFETEALPAIWENPEGFAEAVMNFQTAAAELDTIAASGDMEAFQTQLRATGGTCGACHDDFRVDDD